MKYYKVTCPRGHCGNGQYTEITFYFQAPTMLDAMYAAKRMPSVKHTAAILRAEEVTEEIYRLNRAVSAYERDNQTQWSAKITRVKRRTHHGKK